MHYNNTSNFKDAGRSSETNVPTKLYGSTEKRELPHIIYVFRTVHSNLPMW